MKKLKNLNWLWSALIILGFFVFWELMCLATGIPDFILPRPSEFVVVLFEQFHGIRRHGLQTLMTTTTGFAGGVLAGVIIGAIIGSSKVLYNACYPMLVGFYSIPKVALVPVFVVWFGIGTVPAILTSLVICIFPVVVNVATGLATTEPELEDVLRALGASKLDILWHVGLPRSLPYFFASLKIAITLSFVGTVVSETVAANLGIGSMMVLASSDFNMPLVFAGLVLLASMGIGLYACFAVLERRLTGWAQRKTEFVSG